MRKKDAQNTLQTPKINEMIIHPLFVKLERHWILAELLKLGSIRWQSHFNARSLLEG